MAAGNEPSKLDSEKALAGILGLLAADRDERLSDGKATRKTEVILGDSGLAIGEIAQITGKKYDAVKQTIRRARKA